jgi:predicted  nucleic acid-binding Zn-ribbon protein
MDYTKILLLLNSVLLTFISLLFLVAGYFLRDLHRDFKALIERVNKLYTDLYTHLNWFDNISKLFQKRIESIESKSKELEEKIDAIKNNHASATSKKY